MKITSKECCYLLTGLAIGASAAILLAPKPGAETIASLKHKAKEGVDSVKNQFGCASSTAKQTVQRGKQALRQQTETLSAAVQAGKRAYREATAAPQVN
jgi:gas vesicle protein